MKTLFIIVFVFLFINANQAQTKNSRVKIAYTEKENALKEYAQQKGFSSLKNSILLIAYKKEQILEIWAKSKEKNQFELFKSYAFCTSSGTLGAKRRKGDGQIPEGFYFIQTFNPNSNFYLSLGINYPNASDKILGEKNHWGGNIYIHGSCCSIGCIPITDDKIKELYVLALEASNTKKIPVYIFPARFDEANFRILKKEYPENVSFWENLKTGYDKFQAERQILLIEVEKNGKYRFK